METDFSNKQKEKNIWVDPKRKKNQKGLLDSPTFEKKRAPGAEAKGNKNQELGTGLVEGGS